MLYSASESTALDAAKRLEARARAIGGVQVNGWGGISGLAAMGIILGPALKSSDARSRWWALVEGRA